MLLASNPASSELGTLRARRRHIAADLAQLVFHRPVALSIYSKRLSMAIC
jgi:hypothetical protein